MGLEVAQEKLANAYRLLDFSERLLDDIEEAPLGELPRIVSLLKKNIRDAKALVNDAEKLIDDTVREIDRKEVEDLVMYDEWAEQNARLLKEMGFEEVGE